MYSERFDSLEDAKLAVLTKRREIFTNNFADSLSKD